MIASASGSISLAMTETLLHCLWQGALLALVACLASRTLGRRSAQARYWISMATLLVMADLLPATLLVLSALEPSRARFAVLGAVELWRIVGPCLIAIYLAGVATMLARLLAAVWHGRRLRRSSRPVARGAIAAALVQQARLFRFRRPPAAFYCETLEVPAVIGVRRPAILLPVAVETSLKRDEAEALLTHELAHIERHEHLFSLLQRVLEAVLFFHPAAWYVSRKITIEREKCCDELVLKASAGRLTYAESLLRATRRGYENSTPANLATLT